MYTNTATAGTNAHMVRKLRILDTFAEPPAEPEAEEPASWEPRAVAL